jgi:AcrR family transcriptional regulator
MLTMRSTTIDDRTARARIRDAALERFAVDGFHRATIRAIAADADVSPALVLHHFRSKDGLRAACDEHVLRLLSADLEQWITAPDEIASNPSSFATMIEAAGGIVGYVGRALVEGGDHTDALVDRFVEIAEQTLADGEARGTMRPARDRRAMAAVLVIWDLATIVLGDHLARALEESDPSRVLLRYAEVALEIFDRGMLAHSTEGS